MIKTMSPVVKRGMVTDIENILNDATMTNDEKLAAICSAFKIESDSIKDQIAEMMKAITEIRDVDVDHMLSTQLLHVSKSWTTFNLSMAELQTKVQALEKKCQEMLLKDDLKSLIDTYISEFVKLGDVQAMIAETEGKLKDYTLVKDHEGEVEARKAVINAVWEKINAMDAIISQLNVPMERLQQQLDEFRSKTSTDIESLEARVNGYTNQAKNDLQNQITTEVQNRAVAVSNVEALIKNKEIVLTNKIETNARKIEQLESDLLVDQTDLETHKTENIAKFDEVAQTLQQHQSQISQNSQDIDNHATKFEEHEEKLNDHETRLGSVEAKVPTMEENISVNASEISAVKGDIEGVHSTITRLEESNQTIEDKHDTLETRMNEELDAIKTSIHTNKDTNDAEHTEIHNEINSVKEVLVEYANNNEDIRKLQQTVYGVDGNVNDESSLINRVKSFHDSVVKIWEKLADLQSYSGFKEDLETLKEIIGSERTIDGLVPEIKAIQEKIETLKSQVEDTSALDALAASLNDLRASIPDVSGFLTEEAANEKYANVEHEHSQYQTKEEAVANEATYYATFASKTDIENLDDNYAKQTAVEALQTAVDGKPSMEAVEEKIAEKAPSKEDFAELQRLMGNLADTNSIANRLETINDEKTLREMAETLNVDITHKKETRTRSAEVVYVSNLTGIEYVIEEAGEVPENLRNQMKWRDLPEVMVRYVPDREYVFIPKFVFIPNEDGYEKHVVRTFALTHVFQHLENMRCAYLDSIDYVVGNNSIGIGCQSLEKVVLPNLLYFAKSNYFFAGCAKDLEIVIPMACRYEKFDSEDEKIKIFFSKLLKLSVIDGFTYDSASKLYGYELPTRAEFLQKISNYNKELPEDERIDLDDDTVQEYIDNTYDAIMDILNNDSEKIIARIVGQFNDETIPELTYANLKGYFVDLIKAMNNELADNDIEAAVNAYLDATFNDKNNFDFSKAATKEAFLGKFKEVLKDYVEQMTKVYFTKSWGNSDVNARNTLMPSFMEQLYANSYTVSGMNPTIEFEYYTEIDLTGFYGGNYKNRPTPRTEAAFADETQHGENNPFEVNLAKFQRDTALLNGEYKPFRMIRVFNKSNDLIKPEKFNEVKFVDKKGATRTINDLWDMNVEPDYINNLSVSSDAIRPERIIRRRGNIHYPSTETFDEVNGKKVPWSGVLYAHTGDINYSGANYKETLMDWVNWHSASQDNTYPDDAIIKTEPYYPYSIRIGHGNKYKVVVRNARLYCISTNAKYNALQEFLTNVVPGLDSTSILTAEGTLNVYGTTYSYKYNTTLNGFYLNNGTEITETETNFIPCSPSEISDLKNKDIITFILDQDVMLFRGQEQTNYDNEGRTTGDDNKAKHNYPGSLILVPTANHVYTAAEAKAVREDGTGRIAFGGQFDLASPEIQGVSLSIFDFKINGEAINKSTGVTDKNGKAVSAGSQYFFIDHMAHYTDANDESQPCYYTPEVCRLLPYWVEIDDDLSSQMERQEQEYTTLVLAGLVVPEFYGNGIERETVVNQDNTTSSVIHVAHDQIYTLGGVSESLLQKMSLSDITPTNPHISDNVGLSLSSLLLVKLAMNEEISKILLDDELLIRGFFGKYNIVDSSMINQIVNFYDAICQHIESFSAETLGNMTVARLEELVAVTYFFQKAFEIAADGNEEFVAKFTAFTQRKLSGDNFFAWIQENYPNVAVGYNNSTATFAGDYFNKVDSFTKFCEFFGYLWKYYITGRKILSIKVEPMKNVLLSGFACVFPGYKTAGQSYFIVSDLSSFEWDGVKTLYEDIDLTEYATNPTSATLKLKAEIANPVDGDGNPVVDDNNNEVHVSLADYFEDLQTHVKLIDGIFEISGSVTSIVKILMTDNYYTQLGPGLKWTNALTTIFQKKTIGVLTENHEVSVPYISKFIPSADYGNGEIGNIEAAFNGTQ